MTNNILSMALGESAKIITGFMGGDGRSNSDDSDDVHMAVADFNNQEWTVISGNEMATDLNRVITRAMSWTALLYSAIARTATATVILSLIMAISGSQKSSSVLNGRMKENHFSQVEKINQNLAFHQKPT